MLYINMKCLKGYIPSIVTLNCSNSIIINTISYMNIFRLKDNIIKKLREKYTSNTLIIHSQYYHDLFPIKLKQINV